MSQILITLDDESGGLQVEVQGPIQSNKLAVLGLMDIAKQAIAQQAQAPRQQSPIAVARAIPKGPLRNGN